MKNWKRIFKKKYPNRYARYIVENICALSIPRRELHTAPLDTEADAETAKLGDTVYERCGEVFRLS